MDTFSLEESIVNEFSVQPYMFEPELRRENDFVSDSDSEYSSSVEEENQDGTRSNNIDWCTCSNCVLMDDEHENKCCQEYNDLSEKLETVNCIVDHPGFEGNCLNPWVIEVSFFEFLQTNGPIGDEQPVHKVYRYVAYRKLARFIWHLLPKHDRRVLPACAVTAIHAKFPSEEYTGFKYARERQLN